MSKEKNLLKRQINEQDSTMNDMDLDSVVWNFTVNELDSIINCVTDMKDEYAGEDERQKEYYDKIINKFAYASSLVKSFKSNVINHDKEVKIKLIVQFKDGGI